MAHVSVRKLGVSFGHLNVLENLDLDVEQGEFIVLLGPSGCGKSTLLNAIAGLLDINAGQIWIGGDNVTWKEPKDRHIGMVFQSYALYPRMTAEGNLTFGLRVARVPKAEIERRVARAAELLQIQPLLKRRPMQLSGGQRQRVAIGRALVREPEVFLFDEPLSNLDAMLRVQMRVEIAKLHKDLSATMIYVTHDQVEAMTLADKIVVLDHGLISQVGGPMDLYMNPANKFVASFIGSPTMNFVSAQPKQAEGLDATLDLPGGRDIRVKTKKGLTKTSNGGIEVGIRPEHVSLGSPDDPRANLTGTVQILERLGNATIMYIETPAGQIVVQDDGDVNNATGENVGVIFDPTRVHVFTADAKAA